MMTDESVQHAWQTVPVPVVVDIDHDIAPLVLSLNAIPNVRTFASCSGHLLSTEDARAYVMVGWAGSEQTQGRFFRALSRLVERLDMDCSFDTETGYLRVPREDVGRFADEVVRWFPQGVAI